MKKARTSACDTEPTKRMALKSTRWVGTFRALLWLPQNTVWSVQRAPSSWSRRQQTTAHQLDFELESAAADDSTPTGLRRDRYPFCHWLYDHAREPLADPKAELEYWKGYVWQGYHDLLENYARMQMAMADRYQKLNFAIAGLSYDLAVLQANYAIDRDLRGEEAMRAFQDEGADLLKEVTAAWRTSGERLDLSFEDDPEAVKDFAQPFHRVRDDLRRLLHDLPPTPPTQ